MATRTRKRTEHYTRISAGEMRHTHPDCGCSLKRDDVGAVSLYLCDLHEAAPRMLLELRRIAEGSERAAESPSNGPFAATVDGCLDVFKAQAARIRALITEIDKEGA